MKRIDLLLLSFLTVIWFCGCNDDFDTSIQFENGTITYHSAAAGWLSTYIRTRDIDKTNVTSIILSGTIGGEDISAIRELPALQNIDMSSAQIEANKHPYIVYDTMNTGLQTDYKTKSDTISSHMFYGLTTIKTVRLPKSVLAIEDRVFCGCSALESVEIPNSVVSIGAETFRSCKSLKNIDLPAHLTAVPNELFMEAGLKSITIPSEVKTIGERAFAWCPLTNVDISESVETIERGAFCACDALESVALPTNLTSLGGSAFTSCLSLKAVTIPESIKYLAPETFSHCVNLSEVKLNEGLISIGADAFYRCSRLESITIPLTVTLIAAWAFSSCNALKTLYFTSDTPADIGSSYIFADCSASLVVYVPSASVSAYKEAQYWNGFADLIKGYDL